MATSSINPGPTLETHSDTENPNISYQTSSSEHKACSTVGNVPDEEKSEVAYSAFTEREKIMTVLMVSFIGLFSPLSANIYYPALNSLANDLDVSITLIGLTITTYMVRNPLVLHTVSMLIEPTDPSRSRTIFHWKLLRYQGPQTCLLDMLHHLPGRQHRSGFAEQLCRTHGPSLSSERRQ